MIRFVPAAAIPALIGLPIWVEPSVSVGLVALISGLISTLAVAASSLGSAIMGGVLALIALAIALWEPSSPMSVFGAAAFGLSLLLLVEGVHFARRFSRATIDRAAWRRQAAWWARRGAIVVGIAVILAASGPALAILLPAFGRPILAGIGALVAFAAAMSLVWPREGWR